MSPNKSGKKEEGEIEAPAWTEREKKLEKMIETALYYDFGKDSLRIEFLRHRYESLED